MLNKKEVFKQNFIILEMEEFTSNNLDLQTALFNEKYNKNNFYLKIYSIFFKKFIFRVQKSYFLIFKIKNHCKSFYNLLSNSNHTLYFVIW